MGGKCIKLISIIVMSSRQDGIQLKVFFSKPNKLHKKEREEVGPFEVDWRWMKNKKEK